MFHIIKLNVIALNCLKMARKLKLRGLVSVNVLLLEIYEANGLQSFFFIIIMFISGVQGKIKSFELI